MRGQVSGRGFGAQGQGHGAGKAPPRSASRTLSDRKESPRHKGTIGRVTAALPAITRSSPCEGLREQTAVCLAKEYYAALERRHGRLSRNCQGKMPMMQYQFLKSKRKAKCRLLCVTWFHFHDRQKRKKAQDFFSSLSKK